MNAKLLALASAAVLGLGACGTAPPVTPAAVQTAPSAAALASAAGSATTAEAAANLQASTPAPAAASRAPATADSAAPGALPAEAGSAPSGSERSKANSAAPAASLAPASAAASTQPAASVAPSAPAKPAVAVAPIPAKIRLGPLVYIRQTLNNCGPAAIAEVLHYWGVEQTQAQAMAALRPDGNSRGMWPYPVPAYIQSQGMSSLMGVGGNPTLVKALVANGFPVIAAQWVSAADHTGHYREIEGFDDARQVFVSTDSYLGPNHEVSYSEFDQIWARGNQRFMVIYPPAKQALLDATLASVGWSKQAAYQADLVKQAEQRQSPPPSDAPRGGFFRPGDRLLGQAWDHIQLGQLDVARAELQQASQGGANQLMLGWLNKALTAAS